MSILYQNPLDTTGDSDFTIVDPTDGLEIPYLPHHLVGDSPAGPSFSGGYEQGFTATMTFITPSKTHARFCQLMLGKNYLGHDGTRFRMYRHLPHKLPLEGDDTRIFGYRNMYASGIQNVGFIGGPDPYHYVSGSSGEKIRRPTFGNISNDYQSDSLKYAYAVVTVLYTPMPYNILPDEEVAYNEEYKRFTTIQKVPRVEFLNVKAGTLKWIDAPPLAEPSPVEDDRVPIRDGTTDYVVTFHRIPWCISSYGTLIGSSNSNGNFLDGMRVVPSGGFDIDTMLLTNIQEVQLLDAFEDMFDVGNPEASELGFLFTYNFFFQYKPNGHNAALRRKLDKATNLYEFDYNKFSFTGKDPAAGTAGNVHRAIKQGDMTRLFRYE